MCKAMRHKCGHTIEGGNMNEAFFVDKYAYSGRPLLVKNATYDWKAMNSFDFEFFRGEYFFQDFLTCQNFSSCFSIT